VTLERSRAEKQDPRHAKAVANSLRFATEAAERGDYVEALAWVDTVRAIGDDLPPEIHASRSSWLERLRQGGGDGSKVDGKA
jgi:hypothetical protein